MLIISGLRMWMRWCFHLNTMFTTGLEKTRRIKDLHINFQQSQEALADHQEQVDIIIDVIHKGKTH